MSRPNVKIKTLGEVDAKTQYGFRMTSALLDRLRQHCSAYHEPIGEFIEAAVVKALDTHDRPYLPADAANELS